MHGYMNINPMLAYVPTFLINFMVKRVLYVMAGRMASKELFEQYSNPDTLTEEQKDISKVVKELIKEFVDVPEFGTGLADTQKKEIDDDNGLFTKDQIE